MEFTVAKHQLQNELLLLQGAVERKTTMPILANILVEATPEGRLRLVATDLDLSIETSCPATVKKSGGCALPARRILDYVKLLPESDISVKRLENHWVQLRCGRANTRMVGMSRENFPERSEFPATGAIQIPAAALDNLMQKTVFAISSEESRYTLNGALAVLKPKSLAMVSTDGHRLAHIVDEAVSLEGAVAETKALIPKKAMAELLGILAQCEEGTMVAFGQDESRLYFQIPRAGGARLLHVRKLTGQFPNYEAVLPKAKLHSLPLNREEFLASILRVAQFADPVTHAIRVRIEADKLIIAASGKEGETDEEIEVSFGGDPVMIGFNAKYLQDFLTAIATDEVLLEFKDDSSAAQLRPLATDGAQYRYVVMPMRI